jgi:hypothetical protein
MKNAAPHPERHAEPLDGVDFELLSPLGQAPCYGAPSSESDVQAALAAGEAGDDESMQITARWEPRRPLPMPPGDAKALAVAAVKAMRKRGTLVTYPQSKTSAQNS